jgi:adenosylmethionine---8-amino-7-oxononanoate aminotransferase
MDSISIAEELSRIEAAGLARSMVPLSGAADAEVEVAGRRMLMLSSNNYLGLATHMRLRAAAASAVERYGTGAGASRLVAGDLALHHDVETRLARFKGTEAALLFTSGYHANIGTIAALVSSDDQVFSDALNHASIIDGCRLARARVAVYPHRDTTALRRLLAETPVARRRLIVTDSVFSMDGDLAPLAELVEVAREGDAWLMVDEAHATGTFGKTGAGLAEALGLAGAIDVSMGTLGKALGGFGAYVAGSRALIDLLVNRARSFIYTTAPPPATVAAAAAALEIVAAEPERRRALWARAEQLRKGLADLGFKTSGESHIVPLLVGDNAAALGLADALYARGVFVRAIRPPTVPPGTARLRLTPMATHTEAQIDRALAAFAEAGYACGLIQGNGSGRGNNDPARQVDCRSRASSGHLGDLSCSVPATQRSMGHREASRGELVDHSGGLSTRLRSRDNRPGAADAETLAAWDHRYLWHPFTQMVDWLAEEPLIIERGEGNYLIDAAGRRYLDGVSSLWCNIHGHRRPELDAAVRRQLERIAHTTLLGLASEPSICLARALVEHAPAGLTRVFYSDAGATAVEVALRMALQYWHLRGSPQRTDFASLVGAYHGDTLGAVGVGYSEPFHRFVRPAIREALRLTPPHVFRWERGLEPADSLTEAVTEAEREVARHAGHLAAVIVEPLMQGAAGMWAHPIEYLCALREITHRHEVLLICDEVATGFGRTGRLFACEHAAITPDLLCLGKGITGGYMPLAATLATEEIFSAFLGRHEDFVAFFHGHTYTGNPLACAAGVASLGIFDREGVIDRLPPLVTQLGSRLEALAEAHPHVGDVRQWGMMAGIELVRDRATRAPYPATARVGMRVAREVRKHGVILRPLGDVIIVMPPLSIDAGDLDTILDATRAAIRAVTEDGS